MQIFDSLPAGNGQVGRLADGADLFVHFALHRPVDICSQYGGDWVIAEGGTTGCKSREDNSVLQFYGKWFSHYAEHVPEGVGS